MKMPFTLNWEQITPEKARDLLSRNKKNRKLRKHTVNSFARDMRMGKWLATHQGIGLDSDGNLVDGQHTLSGVVVSGVPIWRVVARYIPGYNPMDAIDTGNSRSVADALNLTHGCIEAPAIAAVCSILGGFATKFPSRTNRMSTAQALEVVKLYQAHLSPAVMGRSRENGLKAGVVMAAVAFARAVKPKIVDAFYAQLVSGEGLYKGTPIFTLRNFLLNEPGRCANSEKMTRFEMILTAIYRHMKEQKMERMAIDREAVEYFRSPQADAIARLEEVFPEACEGSVHEVKKIIRGGGD
jgi:hypothetical protein